MSLFLVEGDVEYSYSDLWGEINCPDQKGSQIIERGGVFHIFERLLAGLAREQDIELVDGTLSDTEIKTLGIADKAGEPAEKARAIRFCSLSDFIAALRRKELGGSISIYTSGTTGRPKRVSHDLASLTRSVVITEKHRGDVWALAYNPTHMAGLQVLFQALLNENPLVYTFGTYQQKFHVLYSQYGINRISATPTYYRNLRMLFQESFPGIRSATTGGERSSKTVQEDLRQLFPNARLLNTYASTEAGSLLVSEGEAFRIPDWHKDTIRITDDGEILVHESLLGSSETLSVQEHWFHTGDLVEFVGDDAFKFKSRVCEMINVGGDKVDPGEIESLILEMHSVADVRVYGIKNSVTGELVAADVVPADRACDSRLLTIEIKTILKEILKPYKIPAIINITDCLKTTNSGKKVRR